MVRAGIRRFGTSTSRFARTVRVAVASRRPFRARNTIFTRTSRLVLFMRTMRPRPAFVRTIRSETTFARTPGRAVDGCTLPLPPRLGGVAGSDVGVLVGAGVGEGTTVAGGRRRFWKVQTMSCPAWMSIVPLVVPAPATGTAVVVPRRTHESDVE